MPHEIPHFDQPVLVAALYRFAVMDACAVLRDELEILCRDQAIRGVLLLAREGMNGTVAGPREAIVLLVQRIRNLPQFADIEVKYSGAATMPFHRLNVRLKAEIVTMGVANIDPLGDVGTYVDPEDWNALISDPDTIVIDTRNDYEVAVGTFAGAIDPKTSSFREFPNWFRRERQRLLGEGKLPKVAMFCTGGIRCEKSTAFLRQEGVDQVFHLKGGILKYLETVPEENSLWQGECFVFDQRVTVGHGLSQGHYDLCFACRRPIDAKDQISPQYEEGVSCPACFDERTDAQRAAYRERQRQEDLAAATGQAHIGAPQKGQGR